MSCLRSWKSLWSKSQEQLALSFSDVSTLFSAYPALTQHVFVFQHRLVFLVVDRLAAAFIPKPPFLQKCLNLDSRLLCKSLRFTQEVFLQFNVMILEAQHERLQTASFPGTLPYSRCTWSPEGLCYNSNIAWNVRKAMPALEIETFLKWERKRSAEHFCGTPWFFCFLTWEDEAYTHTCL